VFSLTFSWFALANLWLTFSIIIDLLPDDGLILFGPNNHTGLDIVSPPLPQWHIVLNRSIQTHWVNLALKWVYLSFLAIQVEKNPHPNSEHH
jgi:chitin synthase